MAKAVYLDIARKYNLPYGGVLWYGVLMERQIMVDSPIKSQPRDARECYAIASIHKAFTEQVEPLTVDRILDFDFEIREAVMTYREIKAGERDWLTGERYEIQGTG